MSEQKPVIELGGHTYLSEIQIFNCRIDRPANATGIRIMDCRFLRCTFSIDDTEVDVEDWMNGVFVTPSVSILP